MQVSVNIDIDEKEISNKIESVLNKTVREKVKELVEDCIAKDYEHFIRHHSCVDGFYDKMRAIFEWEFTNSIQNELWNQVDYGWCERREGLDKESFEIGWDCALWMYQNIHNKDVKESIKDKLFDKAGEYLARDIRHDRAHYKKLIEVLESERTTT